MKLLRFGEEGKEKPGILLDNEIIDVSSFGEDFGETFFTNEGISRLSSWVESRRSSLPKVDKKVRLGTPFTRPSKIICIGLNYRKHAIESGMAIPTVPVAFTKYSNTLVDFSKDIQLGKEGEQFDYEVELGVVIGKKCKDVSKDEALNYVLGYCTANDLSCRDLQFKTSQWLLGKSLDYFLPLGKYFVTADEVDAPQKLQLSCTLNGELRQNSNTADMIFSVAEIIEFLSRHMTLIPGDIILTGTPEGVIMGMPVKEWLKPGDIVKVEIEKLGYTENRMA